MDSATSAARAALLRRAVVLEAVTIIWNAIEAILAVTAGVLASSVALIGFGVDSFVETASGAVVGWRLRSELRSHADEASAEALERRAGRIAGVLLLGLALYIIVTPVAGSSASERKRGKAGSGSRSPGSPRWLCRS